MTSTSAKTLPPDECHNLTLITIDVHNVLDSNNTHEAAGPDDIPGCVLQACAEQLAGVFTDILNLSLAQAVAPAGFKTTLLTNMPEPLSPCSTHSYGYEVL